MNVDEITADVRRTYRSALVEVDQSLARVRMRLPMWTIIDIQYTASGPVSSTVMAGCPLGVAILTISLAVFVAIFVAVCFLPPTAARLIGVPLGMIFIQTGRHAVFVYGIRNQLRAKKWVDEPTRQP
jgi:hypothetical protein